MDYRRELENLEHLEAVINAYDARARDSPEESERLKDELAQAYGAVEDIIERMVGRSAIPVPTVGNVQPTVYPNLIEAGYLSGRTFHTYQGRNQLIKVIGKVRALAANSSGHAPPSQGAEPRLRPILQRFRECCQYLADPPRTERAVQDLIWIMLRSHFDQLDREDTLPRFGAKNYRPDFGIPALGELIEVKFIGEKTFVPSIQEEMLADLPGYLSGQTRYTRVFFFVYDGAHKLRDPTKFIEDIRCTEGVSDVMVVPGVG